MKRFNIAKEERKLNRKNNIANNIKIRTIILSIFVLVGSIMLFTYSKYSTSVKLDIMHSKVANFMQDDYIINAYVDGDEDDFPGKDDGYYVDDVVCNKGATGIWDDDDWGLLITNATEEETECNVYFKTIQTVYNFEFDPDNDGKGQEQTFTAPYNGTYKLEVWGAQGYSYNETYYGGYGGYSVGNIILNSGDLLYVNVGEEGKGGCVASQKYGDTYNGGGSIILNASSSQSEYNRCSGTGGGASHIANTSGELATLSNLKGTLDTTNSYYVSDDIYIVAGGGGGSHKSIGAWTCASRGYIGGSAGGYISSVGTDENGVNGNTSYNANQTSGYNFGLGGHNSQNLGSTGGGGWYGGYLNGECAGGGGGSGYVASSRLTSSNGITKHMTCYNCTESSDLNIKTESNTCHDPDPTEECAKEGNGYARITLIKRN